MQAGIERYLVEYIGDGSFDMRMCTLSRGASLCHEEPPFGTCLVATIKRG